jgi:hypothetical protein
VDERRATPRHRVDENGYIAVSEHVSVACMVYDRSDEGVRLTMADTSAVPETFVLVLEGLGECRVCMAAWRTPEEIGAWFDAKGTLIGA